MSEQKQDPKTERAKVLLTTGQELKDALKNWEDLCAQTPEIAPDEKVLQDVQILLKDIKAQLDELGL